MTTTETITDGSKGNLNNNRNNQIKRLIGEFTDIFWHYDCGTVKQQSTGVVFDWFEKNGVIEVRPAV